MVLFTRLLHAFKKRHSPSIFHSTLLPRLHPLISTTTNPTRIRLLLPPILFYSSNNSQDRPFSIPPSADFLGITNTGLTDKNQKCQLTQILLFLCYPAFHFHFHFLEKPSKRNVFDKEGVSHTLHAPLYR